MASMSSQKQAPARPTSTAGPTPRPNGPPPMRRPRPAADPLVRPKNRGVRKPPPTTHATGKGSSKAPPIMNTLTTIGGEPVNDKDDPSTYVTYKLVTTKKSLLESMRFHCMKLHAKNEVNLLNPEDFTPPVRLHRRDPKAPWQGAKGEEARVEQPEVPISEADAEERAKMEALQAEKEAQQRENLAKIAPQGGAVKQKKNMFKKKTQQVFQQNEEEKRLRYEEFFPWMLEDFDNKNQWVGNLEGALSETSVMLIMEEGMFKMVPVEKFYRFEKRFNSKTSSLEEAEAEMKRHQRVSKWFNVVTKAEEKAAMAKQYNEDMKASRKLYTVKGDRLEGRNARAGFNEADELDFEEDFADDEETPIIDGDEEELKQATKKMRREQLSANVFDIRDEKEYEEEEREKKKLEEARKAHGKKVKKALKSHERNFAYEDSDDENPYLSEESEDSEEEALKKAEEEKKKAAEKAAKEEEKKKEKEKDDKEPEKDKDKTKSPDIQKEGKDPSKTSKQGNIGQSKGTTNTQTPNAPSTSNKTSDSKSKTLKRRGSPVASESGNESSQPSSKRPKKTSDPSKSSEALDTPSEGGSKQSKKLGAHKRRRPQGSGSGSEYETGGDMSDGAGSGPERNSKKIRLRVGAGPGTNGSRANSPPTGTVQSKKPGSPDAGRSREGSPAVKSNVITEDEIREVMRGGATMQEMSLKFKSRINATNKNDFFMTLKRVGHLVDVPGRGKLFFPK